MKATKEYLREMGISELNPTVLKILKLTEKNPNYETFFIKSHFGNEHVPLNVIFETFKTMKEKNIKVQHSVDHYTKYAVTKTFDFWEQEYGETINKTNLPKEQVYFEGSIITRKIYKSLPDYLQSNVQIRTNFEAFSDEIRDALTKTNANKIIQQFPAVAKHVVDSLNESEKNDFFFNLNSLLETNLKYLVVNPITKIFLDQNNPIKKYSRGQKLGIDEYKTFSDKEKENVIEEYQKPLIAFIKKSARYKNKEALFADLNAALYSLSGDEEYKMLVERIEDTEGAILEGLNPTKGVVVASALNAEAYKKIGGDKTNHCIRSQHTFNSYCKFAYKQYLITNTKLEPSDDMRIIGLTLSALGEITNAHSKSDVNVKDNISNLLLKWGVAQFIKPMNDDEIIEMLYFGINDGSIFADKERADIVISYLPKLDKSRFDKKKLMNFLRFVHKPEEMIEIIKNSLDMTNSDEFADNYNYLTANILKLISDEQQGYDIVHSLVNEYNKVVGVSATDAMTMLICKSKYIQPNKLIEIIGKDKFPQFVKEYNIEQFNKILEAIPQFYINFVREKDNLNETEITLILKAMYTYEIRKEIRQLIIMRIHERGYIKNINISHEKELLEKIAKDNSSENNAILSIAISMGYKYNGAPIDMSKIKFKEAIVAVGSTIKSSKSMSSSII